MELKIKEKSKLNQTHSVTVLTSLALTCKKKYYFTKKKKKKKTLYVTRSFIYNTLRLFEKYFFNATRDFKVFFFYNLLISFQINRMQNM